MGRGKTNFRLYQHDVDDIVVYSIFATDPFTANNKIACTVR